MADEMTNACGHHSKLLRKLAKKIKTNKKYVVMCSLVSSINLESCIILFVLK